MRMVVWTCITGGYDYLKDPITLWRPPEQFDGPLECANPEWEFLLFTDRPEAYQSAIWKVLPMPEGTPNDPVLAQRYVKTQPHKFMEFDHAIYIDSSMQLRADPELMVMTMAQEYPVMGDVTRKHLPDALFKVHPVRRDIAEEAEAVIKLEKAAPEDVANVLKWVGAIPDPAKYPLVESGFFSIKNTPEVHALMDTWWEGVQVCHRDQLSLPEAIKRTGVAVTYFSPDEANWIVDLAAHCRRFDGDDLKINYRICYAPDGNLGAEYNRQAEGVADGEWVCFMDGDAMFLDNIFGYKVARLIHDNPFIDIFGCITNRLSDTAQLFGARRSEDPSMLSHKLISEAVWKEFDTKVERTEKPIAGLFMLMRKDVWADVRFRNGLLRIDTDFMVRAMAKGYTVGIAKGLYMMHYYRLMEGVKELSHLKDALKLYKR